jgi:hypothetical protein
MFAYPKRALYDHPLPKNKVYGHTEPSRALRQKFVDQVEEIVWLYKLAPETINLPSSAEVAEIQIFSIAQRTPELKEDVLRTLDRAIPSLLFFELAFQGKVRFAAAYKRTSEADQKRQFVATYYLSAWQDATIPREPLPVAIHLGSLYEQMLHKHMLAAGLSPRHGETLAETAERGNRIRAKQLACQRLETALKREDQFNRKVEINSQLRQALEELQELGRVNERHL